MEVICLLADIWDRGPPGSPFFLLSSSSLFFLAAYTLGFQCAEHSSAVLLRVQSFEVAAITALGNMSSMVSRHCSRFFLFSRVRCRGAASELQL